MENAFYFVLKALFVLEILKMFVWLFGYVGKRFGKKVKVNFKNYNVTGCIINNCNTHIVQYFKK